MFLDDLKATLRPVDLHRIDLHSTDGDGVSIRKSIKRLLAEVKTITSVVDRCDEDRLVCRRERELPAASALCGAEARDGARAADVWECGERAEGGEARG